MSSEVARSFLRRLFERMPAGYSVLIRLLPGGQTNLIDLNSSEDDGIPTTEELQAHDSYFGVTPRGANQIIDIATFVALDVDHGLTAPLSPRPTVKVNSGREGGLHAYWVFNAPVQVNLAMRLARLAAMAYGGDLAICNSKHVIRIAGSMNRKYDPPRPCTLADMVDIFYDAPTLEENFVAQVISKYWEEDQRHEMALALGAILSRANWTEDRVESCVRAVCRLTGDTDLRDRITAAKGTLQRQASGTAVSAAFLKDALDKDFRPFIDALGITARDGELLLDGVQVGVMPTLERDMVDYVLSTNDWVWSDGRPAHWAQNLWKPCLPEEVASSVFKILGKLHFIEQGLEVEFPATAKLARAVSGMVLGDLASHPMDDIADNFTPLENGILDTHTGELFPHDKKFGNRWVLPVSFDANAECPMWLAFLEEMFPETKDFLQEFIGYCLVSGNPWQKMLWLFGPSSTGKSTVLYVVEKMFGESCIAVVPDRLNDYSLASLSGKRLALCSEMSSRTLKTPVLKSLVTGDAVQARMPYGQPFSLQFEGKIMWGSNALPQVDQGEGFWRRLLVVHANVHPRKDDKFLKTKIVEQELSGVLNWALEGLARVRQYSKDGEWPLPACVEEIVNEYQRSSDLFTQFLEDETIRGENETFNVIELYQRYCWWCKDRGNDPDKYGPAIWQALSQSGFKEIKDARTEDGRVKRLWRGARLTAAGAVSTIAEPFQEDLAQHIGA